MLVKADLLVGGTMDLPRTGGLGVFRSSVIPVRCNEGFPSLRYSCFQRSWHGSGLRFDKVFAQGGVRWDVEVSVSAGIVELVDSCVVMVAGLFLASAVPGRKGRQRVQSIQQH